MSLLLYSRRYHASFELEGKEDITSGGEHVFNVYKHSLEQLLEERDIEVESRLEYGSAGHAVYFVQCRDRELGITGLPATGEADIGSVPKFWLDKLFTLAYIRGLERAVLNLFQFDYEGRIYGYQEYVRGEKHAQMQAKKDRLDMDAAALDGGQRPGIRQRYTPKESGGDAALSAPVPAAPAPAAPASVTPAPEPVPVMPAPAPLAPEPVLSAPVPAPAPSAPPVMPAPLDAGIQAWESEEEEVGSFDLPPISPAPEDTAGGFADVTKDMPSPEPQSAAEAPLGPPEKGVVITIGQYQGMDINTVFRKNPGWLSYIARNYRPGTPEKQKMLQEIRTFLTGKGVAW